MNSPENDLIGSSMEAFQRSTYTNTAFCEITLKEALGLTFRRDEDEGAMVVLGAGLVCSQLDVVVSSAALKRFSLEDQAHTEKMRGFMAAGLPDQASEYIRARYRLIESDLEARHPNLYATRREVAEILSGGITGEDFIETFTDSSLRAYRRFQLQDELGVVDTPAEEPVDTNRVIPFVRKTNVLDAYLRIVLNWRRFVDEVFDELVPDNLKWVARLKMPMTDKEEGYENYVLYAALVVHCFLNEFRALGKPFSEIDTETDRASEAELLGEADSENAGSLQREKALRIFEEMGKSDQNPNLLKAISDLFRMQDLETGSRQAIAARMGAYHAYNSIKNQLEADYWKEKISFDV